MRTRGDGSLDIDDIVSIVNVDEKTCYECMPCDHPVTFVDKQGNVRTSKYINGAEILYLLEKFHMPVSGHFEYYRSDTQYLNLIAGVSS